MPFRDDKVEDVMAVLTLIRNAYRDNPKLHTITALRGNAVKNIAKTELQSKRFKDYNSAHKSIHDACGRRLKPDVIGIAAFDKLVASWLRQNSMGLKEILSTHANGDSQRAAVNTFFEDQILTDASKLMTSNKSGGAGFGNPEENKEVETAAIAFVTKLYESEGWQVVSVENEKCGFDLICTRGTTIENVEVKGIKGDGLGFIITTGELEEAKNNNKFILYAITQALSAPHPHRFSGPELSVKFTMTPLQFRALYKKTITSNLPVHSDAPKVGA